MKILHPEGILVEKMQKKENVFQSSRIEIDPQLLEEFGERASKMREFYLTSPEYQKLNPLLRSQINEVFPERNIRDTKYVAPFCVQFSELLRREIRNMIRNPLNLLLKSIQLIVLAGFITMIYYEVQVDSYIIHEGIVRDHNHESGSKP